MRCTASSALLPDLARHGDHRPLGPQRIPDLVQVMSFMFGTDGHLGDGVEALAGHVLAQTVDHPGLRTDYELLSGVLATEADHADVLSTASATAADLGTRLRMYHHLGARMLHSSALHVLHLDEIVGGAESRPENQLCGPTS